MTNQETWLTIRVRCSSPGAALAMLNRFTVAEKVQPTPTTESEPIEFQLAAGAYPVGTALVGTPGGDEFERALQ